MTEDINAAVSSAVSEATTELGNPAPAPDSEPATETAPDTGAEAEPDASPDPDPEPAPKPTKAAKAKPEPADDDEDEFWRPTAEELAAIEANPELKKVYRSMQRGLTKKTQDLAQKKSELSEKARVADWIQADPEAAIKALAQAAGVSIAEAKKEVGEQVVDGLEAKWAETVGADAAKLLRPLRGDREDSRRADHRASPSAVGGDRSRRPSPWYRRERPRVRRLRRRAWRGVDGRDPGRDGEGGQPYRAR
jgi:hypothetical protein